jgi:cell wall-associated NlpC family hydrolase
MTHSKTTKYQCLANLNLYDSPQCNRLATQAARGRQLQMTSNHENSAIKIYLCEDNYPGWLSSNDVELLTPAILPYQPQIFTTAEIQAKIPEVIKFTQEAQQQSNYYLWGGTVAPNYDCSGLMQAAFQSVNIWIPRDAYQQEAFTQKIDIQEIQPGDLIFFGTTEKATHVGLYLGDNSGDKLYIHSSGKDQGRNGIGIDKLSADGDEISQNYYQQLRGAGRVIKNYIPEKFDN